MTTSAPQAPEADHPEPAGRLRPEPRHWAVAGLLLVAALLFCVDLSRNGYGNEFYAAASQAGGLDWKAWLFASLDPGNIITVDKPPAATWVSALSVRAFGLSSWSVLLPQAIEGVLAVGVLYATVRRVLLRSGSEQAATIGGLLAGGVLALTPAADLIFRFNNPDALLVLLMLVAAYCVVRACQASSWKWIAWCGVALGFAFLTKTLQGLLVLPGYGLAYLMFARPRPIGPAHFAPGARVWLSKARDLAIGVVALVVSSGWYVLLTILWPADARPYLGGSSNNTFMDLALGYNGLARIFGGEGPGSGGHHGGGGGFHFPGGGAPGTSFGGDPGFERLLSNEFGNEISWLLPAALVVIVAAVVLAARRRLDRDVAIGLTVFGTWFVVTAVVFAGMSGIVHPYYTVALAPAIGALVGIGTVIGWRSRDSWAGTGLLVALVAVSAAWGVIRAWRAQFAWPALGWATAVLGVVGIAALVIGRRYVGLRAVTVAVLALAGGGVALATIGINTVGTGHQGGLPAVVVTSVEGQWGFGGGHGPGGGHGSEGGHGPAFGFGHTDPAVLALLRSTHTEWSAAVQGAMVQGPLQLYSGTPVIAIGGFGGDPAPTLAQFQKLVAQGRVGYFIDGGFGPRSSSDISDWVHKNFTATTVGGSTVYKLTR
ncbi:glycosyltransferase family 39 protein [Tsukamurella soli]|uniref:glycosyltransferase family 39 protein n=1 Tax=Tsukamurella soli TaxID=644556 RepID=UPI0031EF8EA0